MKKLFSISIFISYFFSCSAGLIFNGNIQKREVTIYRDNWGVPHIFGETDADVAFGLAYAQAEDDLDNMIYSLLAARGQLGEFFGREHAANDYLVQLLGLWNNLNVLLHNMQFLCSCLTHVYAVI